MDDRLTPLGITPRVPRRQKMATVFRVTTRRGDSLGVASTIDGVIELAQRAPRRGNTGSRS